MNNLQRPRKTFLLADDDHDDRDLFVLAMESADPSVKCVTVKNGREALDLIREGAETYDLIFLDLNMPVMSGWACLECLRQEGFSMPVVIFTTSSREEDIEQARRLGATHFFTKPETFTSLVQVLSIIADQVQAGTVVPIKRSAEQRYLECF